jgi:hypothetical protein
MKTFKLKKLLIGGNNKCKHFEDMPSIVNTDRDKIKRIIAIGDIHGDLQLMLDCLILANVIIRVNNETVSTLDMREIDDSEIDDDVVELLYVDNTLHYYKWIGRETIVVQVGDQVDRCRPLHNTCAHPDETVNDEASDIKILFFFYELHLKALKYDCAVYSLLGNHELLNILGNLNYVSYLGLEEFRKKDSVDIFDGRISAFKVRSDEKLYKNKYNIANFLACTRLSCIIIDKYLFVHAGLLEKLIKSSNNSIEYINEKIKLWLLDSLNKEDIKFVNKLLGGKELSPFWPRILGNLKPNLKMDHPLCQKHVKPILELLNINGVVVGHTPQTENINSSCDNRVWKIDVASSQAFDNVIYLDKDNHDKIKENRKPQVLEINLVSNTFNVHIKK